MHGKLFIYLGKALLLVRVVIGACAFSLQLFHATFFISIVDANDIMFFFPACCFRCCCWGILLNFVAVVHFSCRVENLWKQWPEFSVLLCEYIAIA